MKKLKNNKGVTMIALVTAIVILSIILGIINYSSKSGLELKKLNNMYADVLILEEKIALYYLENGTLPTKGTPLEKVAKSILENNPNNNQFFYEIDISKLGSLTLNNGIAREENEKDRFIVNEASHTVYYQKGILLDGKYYYTTPEKYEKIDLSLYQD